MRYFVSSVLAIGLGSVSILIDNIVNAMECIFLHVCSIDRVCFTSKYYVAKTASISSVLAP